MDNHTAFKSTTQVIKRPFQIQLKACFLNCLQNMWDWYWLNLNFFSKCLFLIGVVMPLTILPLALIFDNPTNTFLQIIHMLGGFSIFILGFEFLWFTSYMFQTPTRRRIFYLLIMVLLWCAAGLALWLSDDPDIHQRFTIAATVGSAWFCVPMFLSFFRPVYYYDDD